MDKVSYITAFNKFFGKKEGQSMSEFSQEIKAAWNTDQKGWTEMFATVGYDTTP